MVQITPLLAAVSVLSRFNPTDSAGNDLVARQSGISTSDLPSACQSPCQVINTLANCAGNLSCECSSSLGKELELCMDCLVGADPAVQSSAQDSLSAWNEGCNGNLSLKPSSSSSSKLNDGNALGFTAGGVAVCVLAVLASASMCF